MNAEEWQHAQSIFGQVADLPREHQRRRIEELCAGNQNLASTVQELLDEDADVQPLFDGNAGSAIGEIAREALNPDHLRSLVQQSIGSYRLIRVLGEGGMGVVYLAERTEIGGLVAIKLLRDAWLSPMRRERFALEQQMLVKLNHPGIARLYEASTTDGGIPWFAMEYADGRPLTEYLRERNGSLHEDLILFRQVCEAVQYAHAHAIIHRDLKPTNILVTADGAVKLLDFGIGKEMQPDPDVGQKTVDGLRLLTPGYAAPEQYSGGDIGVFTDVYSLGVLLYEILTGEVLDPETARTNRLPQRPSSVLRNSGPRPAVSKRAWTDLDVLCLTALQPEPELRYNSVDALQRDLTAFLEGRVLEARPSSVAYTVRKFVQRNWLPVVSTGTTLLLLATTATIFTIRLARARNIATAEAERTKHIQHFLLDMLGNADQEAAPSNELKVVTLLDRASQQAGALAGDAETQVELDKTIGSMYDRLGKYEKSEQILSQALDTASRSSGANSPAVAAVLVQLGTLRGDRGNVKQAQADLQKVFDIAKANRFSANDPTLVQAKVAMARIDVQSGVYQKAIDLLSPLTAPGSKVAPYDRRDSLAVLGVAAQEASQLDLAETVSREAIEMDKHLLGESHVQTGVDLINLGSLKSRQGDLLQAEKFYQEGISIMKSWYGPDHPDVAMTSNFLARILIMEKKSAEAEVILPQVLSVLEKAYGPVHVRVAYTVSLIGDCASARGDFQTAEVDYKRAADIYGSILGNADPHTAAMESNLGNLYLKESKYALAEQTLRKLDNSISATSPQSPMTAVVRARLGRALLALKRYPEAEAKLTSAHELMKAQQKFAPDEYKSVCSSLVSLYLTTNQLDKAKLYRSELSSDSAER